MSDLRTAAQQVVDERDAGFRGWPLEKAIDALKAALAEPQEPVAFAFRHSDGSWHDISETEHSAGMTALYTHPAPQRQPHEPSRELLEALRGYVNDYSSEDGVYTEKHYVKVFSEVIDRAEGKQ